MRLVYTNAEWMERRIQKPVIEISVKELFPKISK